MREASEDVLDSHRDGGRYIYGIVPTLRRIGNYSGKKQTPQKDFLNGFKTDAAVDAAYERAKRDAGDWFLNWCDRVGIKVRESNIRQVMATLIDRGAGGGQ